ncbi:MAG: coproporphyrinogen III oxidase family protein [Thermodesulfobacteriota bacterium]|nr:coproporphyrinogen III oxidase family protein [Thermodesulfobacteriota bacterium]
MIGKIITEVTKSEFSRAMRFTERVGVSLPPGESNHNRLLYLHVPFCESLCPYCSFNRVVFDESLCRRYHAVLRKEIILYGDKGYNFTGVYVGGGTPTILMDELEETLAVAADCFSIREISVETNPNHLTRENVDVLKTIGVNRLSVGVQSFDDGLLKAMGRYEKYGSGNSIAEKIVGMSGQFDTLNADMIFNFPVQTEEILTEDLNILIDTGVDQVTYYPLMVSDSTRRKVEGSLGLVDYRKEKKSYHLISRKLAPYYRFSSAWCFSRRGTMVDEYIVDYDEYAGLGSGSIGYMDGRCYANTFDIPRYIEMLNKGEIPLMASRDFTPGQQARYDFLMKLFGLKLDISFLNKKYRGGGIGYLWSEIIAFILAGGLRYKHGTLYLTDRGRYYWVIMMREFFTAVNNFRDFCLRK